MDLAHLAYDESVGQLFAIETEIEPVLVTLDPSTGDTAPVGAPVGQEQVGGGNWRLFDPRTRLLWASCSATDESICAVCVADGTVPVALRTEPFPYFVYPL